MKKTAWLVVCLLAISACRRAHAPAIVSEVSMASASHRDRVLRGIFPGEGGWRWTEPGFAVSLDPPASASRVYLEMDFTVPEELMAAAAEVTVAAKINGAEVARQTYQKQGRYTLAAQLPTQVLSRRPAEVQIAADRSFTDPGTSQRRSLILVSLGLKEYEQTAEFRDAEMIKSHQAYEAILHERDLKIPREKQNDIMRIFHDLAIWEHLQFQGVQIIKNPLDLWMLQQIAWEVRPDYIVETGTFFGGSALYWANILNGMGLENARVLTVDIQDLTKGAAPNPLWKKYVTFYLGSSTDPKIVDGMARQIRNARVIVNLDSDHSMAHVLRELRMYAPMVSPGSYIAVEDTHLDGVPTHPEQGPGPMAAVRQFLSEDAGKDFEQDFTREAFIMTSYPGGWLRRKTR